MKKYEIFDVVELKNKDRATILGINKETYSVEIVDKDGNTKEVKEISADEVEKIIYTK